MSDKHPISRRRFLQIIGGMTTFFAVLPDFRKAFAARLRNLKTFFERPSQQEQEMHPNVPGQAVIPFRKEDREFETEDIPTLAQLIPALLKCQWSQSGDVDNVQSLNIVVSESDVKICGSCALVLVTILEDEEPVSNESLLHLLETSNSIIVDNSNDEFIQLEILEETLNECQELFEELGIVLGDEELELLQGLFPVYVFPYIVNSLASGQPDTGPPDNGSGGGPGCKPTRVHAMVNPNDWQFDLPTGVEEPDTDADPSECLVFILDTIPPALEELKGQDQSLLQSQIDAKYGPGGMVITPQQYNAMLNTLDAALTTTDLLDSLLVGFSHPPETVLSCGTVHVETAQTNVLYIEYNPVLRLDCTTPSPLLDGDVRIVRKVAPGDHDYPYLAMDHGLFIAGIVHSIVHRDDLYTPVVKLNLYEVLNAYAYGTLDTFLWGLNRVCDKVRQEGEGKCVIINASLTFEFTPESVGEDNYNLMKQSLQQIIDCFRTEIQKYSGMGPTIVAAAGNEGSGGTHPPARLPAALNGVIGVASLERASGGSSPTDLEDYSNLPPMDGFSVFGGRRAGGSDNFKAHPEQGILGAYIGAFPPQTPLTPASSHSFSQTLAHPSPRGTWQPGWARWAGTSFSTAIITGVLTRLATKGVADPITYLQGQSTHNPTTTEFAIVIEQP
ncbi:MAG: S8/S53 family peptidase [Chloroflexi bacterium]|nr:S8/S53 family peptidase [Chloroflexota bacterium]